MIAISVILRRDIITAKNQKIENIGGIDLFTT